MTVSDAEGRLKVDPIRYRIVLPPLPIDLFPERTVVRIEALGYAPREFGLQAIMPNRPGDYHPMVRRIELEPI